MTIYYMQTGGHLLEAWSIDDLAELAQCAHDAGDDVQQLWARGGDRLRPLTARELAAVVLCLWSVPRGSSVIR